MNCLFLSLLIFLCFSVVVQSCNKRMMVALIFTSAVIIHELILGNLEGYWYFASAGIFDVLVAIGICKFVSKPRLVKGLLAICGASVFFNWVGWLLWESYVDPEIINLPFILIYSAAVAIILREETDVGNYQGNLWPFGVLGNSYQDRVCCRNI